MISKCTKDLAIAHGTWAVSAGCWRCGTAEIHRGSLVERRYPEGIFQRIVKSPSFFCAPGIPRMTVMKRMVLRQRNPGKAASALMCKQQVDNWRISLRHDRHDCMNPGTCMKTWMDCTCKDFRDADCCAISNHGLFWHRKTDHFYEPKPVSSLGIPPQEEYV